MGGKKGQANIILLLDKIMKNNQQWLLQFK